MLVLDCLTTAESSQRLHSSCESKSEQGRELVALCDESRQYPELLVIDCLVTAETRQSLHS
jgi:hypothetical protein